jgi:hypothetical protein
MRSLRIRARCRRGKTPAWIVHDLRTGSFNPTMASQPPQPTISFQYPDWIEQAVDWSRACKSDEERMRLAIAISRANIEHGGGPFGAAIFELESGRIVSAGMDCVVERSNCTLHGEMVAFMMAQQRVRSYTVARRIRQRPSLTFQIPARADWQLPAHDGAFGKPGRLPQEPHRVSLTTRER